MNENQVSTYNCFYFKPVVLLACMIKHILIKLATDFKLKSGFEQVMTVKKKKKKESSGDTTKNNTEKV